jgi:hypothetical protein
VPRLIHQKKAPRSFLRRSANNLVKVSCRKKGAKGVALDLATTTLDLSEAGARLLVSAPLKVGEEIVLGLEGPWHEERLLRNGFVVWSFQVTKVGFAVGVQLKDRLGKDVIDKVTIKSARLDY